MAIIVKTWLDENKLTLNVRKTKSMLIGNKKLLNEADYHDVRLDMDSMLTGRGIQVVDSSLTFNIHISKIVF